MSRKAQSRRVTAFRNKTADIRSYGDAELLVHWLNLRIEILREFQLQTVKLIKVLKLNAQSQAPRFKSTIELLLRPLQHCPWKLTPRVRQGGWYVTQSWPLELHGLVLAARLSFRGLEWVRWCRCGKWFLAYNCRSRFCSTQCKRTFEAEQRKTEDGKKRRRKYMKEYRANPKVKQKKKGKKK